MGGLQYSRPTISDQQNLYNLVQMMLNPAAVAAAAAVARHPVSGRFLLLLILILIIMALVVHICPSVNSDVN